MAAAYELRKSNDQEYYFNLKAENGEKILTSEMYDAKPSALNGIEAVKKNSQVSANFKRKVAKNSKPYFVLVAANNEVIGTSEEYSSEDEMKDGIAAVKRFGPIGVLRDLA